MNSSSDIKIDEKIKKTVKIPSRYNIIVLNDDQTPADWVIKLLKTIFRHDQAQAEHLTMSVHESGSAVVGNYSYEIAEQKCAESISASREKGFPLQIVVEQE